MDRNTKNMLDWTQTLVLSIIQGITEFLPVSSQAHLVLLPKLLNWPDQGLVIDVAVHFGTLGGVLGYFYQDTWRMLRGSGNFLRGRITVDGTLVLQLSLATLPVMFVGFILWTQGLNTHFRQVALIGWMSILFGVVLWFADRYCASGRTLARMNYLRALVVGLAQVVALVPGVSRSGICMTTMRALGFRRTDAARFSCLLSIPTILAASTLICRDLYCAGRFMELKSAGVAAGVSFLISLFSIAFMMRWLEKSNFNIFIIYRVLLGVGLLAWAYL